jgi:hypothetical protein
MNTKHTPGPWKAEGWNEIVVNSAQGYTLALAPSGSKSSSLEEIRANARLIAAAPDLSDALRVIVRQAELTRLAFPNAAGRDDWKQVILIARAAIAKAEGNQ